MEDIKKMSDTELTKQIAEKQEELRALRFDVAGSKTRTVHTARDLRRAVARMLTEVRARKNTTESQ